MDKQTKQPVQTGRPTKVTSLQDIGKLDVILNGKNTVAATWDEVLASKRGVR